MKDRNTRRSTIHRRVRRKLRGSAERPRLAVYRTLNHIYVQAIDDDGGRTIAQASSVERDLRSSTGGNVSAAKSVGSLIGQRLQALGLSSVVFDRGGYLYHGRIKALADAARESGLQF